MNRKSKHQTVRAVKIFSSVLALMAAIDRASGDDQPRIMADAAAVRSNSALCNVVASAFAVTSGNGAILEFRLILRNDSDEELRVSDPLSFLSLQFAALDDRVIRVPTSPHRGLSHPRERFPYPSLVEFQEIIQGPIVSRTPLETVKLFARTTTEIRFRCNHRVLQEVRDAVRASHQTMAKVRLTFCLAYVPTAEDFRMFTSPWIELQVLPAN